MSELNSTERVSEDIIAPDARTKEHLENPTSAAWESGSTPSLPSVDSQHSTSDTDSGVGSFTNVTSTASLRSSIYENVEENGRTYHRYKEGKYSLPNDEKEKERLDLQHTLWNVTLGDKLYLAPLGPNPHDVLDFATGTGIWAVDFANLFPSAQVIGTDLSPMQPLYIPSNCSFEVNDAEDEWVFAQKFDYIHARAILSCFKDPKHVFNEAFKSLAPGGYLEIQDGVFPWEYIGEPPVHSDVYRWVNLIIEGSVKIGRPWTNTTNYKRWMEEIGFEDVVEKLFYWPISPWAKGSYYKQIGTICREDFLAGLEGASLKIIKELGWTADEIRAFLVGVQKDFNDPSIRCYCPIKVVYGKKPLLTTV